MLESGAEVLSERLHTVKELAEFFRQKPDWVRRHFRAVPGVVHLGTRRRGKRGYDPILVPERVLRRWLAEHSVPTGSGAELSLLRSGPK